MQILVSIIIPVKNEESNIDPLYRRIKSALDRNFSPWNLIFVDDASRDSTFSRIKKICREDQRVKGLRFGSGQGQDRAIFEGIRHCGDSAAVVMDGDLQDPPELLPEILEHWKEGCDMVLTRRSSRMGDSFFKRFTAALFYLFIRASGREIAEGNFYLIGERGVKKIQTMAQPFPLFRVYVPGLGTKKVTVTFHRQPRREGESKYSFLKMFRLALASIMDSTLPGEYLRPHTKVTIVEKVNLTTLL